jgi:hypothetical protein
MLKEVFVTYTENMQKQCFKTREGQIPQSALHMSTSLNSTLLEKVIQRYNRYNTDTLKVGVNMSSSDITLVPGFVKIDGEKQKLKWGSRTRASVRTHTCRCSHTFPQHRVVILYV